MHRAKQTADPFSAGIDQDNAKAIVRLIKMTVDAARRNKILVSVCGEMAGDPALTALLLGLGIDELSVAPPLVSQIKFMIRRLKLTEAQALAEFALKFLHSPLAA